MVCRKRRKIKRDEENAQGHAKIIADGTSDGTGINRKLPPIGTLLRRSRRLSQGEVALRKAASNTKTSSLRRLSGDSSVHDDDTDQQTDLEISKRTRRTSFPMISSPATTSTCASTSKATASSAPLKRKRKKKYQNPFFKMQQEMERAKKQRELERKEKQRAFEQRRREAYALNAIKKLEFEASLANIR